jgi:hypothetical protein
MGLITLTRINFVCIDDRCRESSRPLDDRLGLVGYLSPQAKRLCCLAGGSWAFDRASDHLLDFCGLKVSDEYIRQVTEALATQLEAFARTSDEPVAAFTQAVGDVEFETDAVKVNTLEGWRDAKLGIFARRPRGVAATPAEWATRHLPKPTARFAFAAIEESTVFARRWASTAEQLGLDRLSPDLTILGDGADWIWNRAGEVFPNARGVLDIFHAAEQIADTCKALLPDSTTIRTQREQGRTRLLEDGYAGLTDWVGATLMPVAECGPALGQMMNYFAGHQDRLNYVLRLRRGQSIGSGMVEGAAKNMIGKRLKANNARWCEGNVNRMGVICSAMYSEYWETFWLAG